jgi:AhpD family alkylhydroperoxidase
MTAPSVRTVRLTLPADASEPGDAYRPVMLPFLHAVSGYDPELTRAIDEYALAAMRERVLDPVTTELVRLRCARVHQCRRCSSRRYAAAANAGASEEFLAQVDFYESSSLPERQKVALRLTDAHIFGSMSDRLRDQVGVYFSRVEAVEISLLVSKFSLQKSLVALGLDGREDDRVLVDRNPDGSVAGAD